MKKRGRRGGDCLFYFILFIIFALLLKVQVSGLWDYVFFVSWFRIKVRVIMSKLDCIITITEDVR